MNVFGKQGELIGKIACFTTSKPQDCIGHTTDNGRSIHRWDMSTKFTVLVHQQSARYDTSVSPLPGVQEECYVCECAVQIG